MSYKLNKTDGSLLVDLVDGQLDTTSSDLTLIGRNYSGFGEVLNENFIQLLENFANSAAPTNPVRGQLWFDTTENRLKVYNGTAFTASGGVTVQATQPNMVAGDLWIDSNASQLYFFDGTNLRLAGPTFSRQSGTSGFQVASVLDTQSITNYVVKMFVGGSLVGVHSNASFTPSAGAQITELVTSANPTGAITKGFNTVGTDYKFVGTSTVSEALKDGAGIIRTGDQYLTADSDDTTTGAISILNDEGLTLGGSLQSQLNTKNAGHLTIQQNLTDKNVEIIVRRPADTSAFKIDTAGGYVGIFKANPTKTLDVGGDVNIDGNLVVSGTQTSIDVTTLVVEDKNIDLGKKDDGTVGNDAAVDDGGIILNSSDGNKTFVWKDGTDSWTSSENIDLASGKGIKIGTNSVLTETALGSSVISAPGLTTIGTLNEATIANVKIGPTDGLITSLNANALRLDSATSSIEVQNKRISGVADPTSAQDVATKSYADGSTVIGVQLDITGLGANAGNGFAPVLTLLEQLFPAGGYTVSGSSYFNGKQIAARANGAIARVRTTDYGTGGGFTIPSIALSTFKNFTPVDQTILAAQRTIQAVTVDQTVTYLGSPTAATKITCSSAHFYESGQAVVISGTTGTNSGANPTTIDGNYTVVRAEDPSEAPNYVSIWVNKDTSGGTWSSFSYNAASGTIERTPVVGAANKQVLEDISDPTGVTGTINFAPTVQVLQFGVNNGAWVFDQVIVP
mgnify:CR=1 FL=1